MSVTKQLLEQLKTVPDKPGVYVFKDALGKPLYIGKGRSLRKRMRSYFSKAHLCSPKTEIMLNRIADFDFYVTDNEVEALILECNLIKKNRPYFNVTLRDDKSYPFLAITLQDEFPRVMVTREIHRKGTKYYGPYTKAYAIRGTLDTLRHVFPVRTCRGSKPGKSTGSPCLNYHIERCLGPCTGQVSKEEYWKMVEQICLFLEGKQEQIIADLERQMKEAAEKLEFEKAAHFRNRLQAARHVLERQKIISSAREDQDVFAVATDEQDACVELFLIRQGKLIGSENFMLRKGAEDVLGSFLKQYYLTAASIPAKVLLPNEVEDRELLEEWLSQRRGSRVQILVPQRGERKKLVELAAENAIHVFELQKAKRDFERKRISQALVELKEHLSLSGIPNRIECFDISTIRGKESVGSMVVFENGRPKKQDYRKFKIKWVNGQNDFAMMQEVVKRRFSHLHGIPPNKSPLPPFTKGGLGGITSGGMGGFASRPDLVIVDGGKPQLTAALSSLKALGIGDVPVVALAKREEELHLPDYPEPISLPLFSEGLYLVKRIRDEAHRFAITYHRGLREKRLTESILDEIPGIGPKRKKQLIEYFRTPQRVHQASLKELGKILPLATARQVYEFLHSEVR